MHGVVNNAGNKHKLLVKMHQFFLGGFFDDGSMYFVYSVAAYGGKWGHPPLENRWDAPPPGKLRGQPPGW